MNDQHNVGNDIAKGLDKGLQYTVMGEHINKALLESVKGFNKELKQVSEQLKRIAQKQLQEDE